MDYHKFLELPSHLKVQAIRKCRPISYTRLRQTCPALDEFCEQERRNLGVYYIRQIGTSSLEMKDRDCDEFCVFWGERQSYSNNGQSEKKVVIQMTADNISHVTGYISGFAFEAIELRNRADITQPLKSLLEAVPYLKVGHLKLLWLTAEQIELVLTSTWKIGELDIDSRDEMLKIIQSDRIKKMKKPLTYNWDNRNNYCQHEIIESARRRSNITVILWELGIPFAQDVLQNIIKEWKENSHFPQYFRLLSNDFGWNGMPNISDIVTELEAFHLSTWDWTRTKWDVWIRKSNVLRTWQLILVKRAHHSVLLEFTLKTVESSTALVKQLISDLANYVSLFKTGCENLETLSETDETIIEVVQELKKLSLSYIQF